MARFFLYPDNFTRAASVTPNRDARRVRTLTAESSAVSVPAWNTATDGRNAQTAGLAAADLQQPTRRTLAEMADARARKSASKANVMGRLGGFVRKPSTPHAATVLAIRETGITGDAERRSCNTANTARGYGAVETALTNFSTFAPVGLIRRLAKSSRRRMCVWRPSAVARFPFASMEDESEPIRRSLRKFARRFTRLTVCKDERTLFQFAAARVR